MVASLRLEEPPSPPDGCRSVIGPDGETSREKSRRASRNFTEQFGAKPNPSSLAASFTTSALPSFPPGPGPLERGTRRGSAPGLLRTDSSDKVGGMEAQTGVVNALLLLGEAQAAAAAAAAAAPGGDAGPGFDLAA